MTWPVFQAWQRLRVDRQRARAVAQVNAQNREQARRKWYGERSAHG